MENRPQRTDDSLSSYEGPTADQTHSGGPGTVDRARDKVGEVADTTRERASQATDYVRSHSPGEIASDAREKASQLADRARVTADVANERADEMMSTAGRNMTNLAQTVRERAPQQGRISDIATGTADALERSGQYLQQADLNVVRGDLEGVMRSHPVETVLVGLGVGFLFARSMRR